MGLGLLQTTSLGKGSLGEIPLREALTSSSEDSLRVLGLLELVVPLLSSSLFSSQAAYGPFLSPNLLF